MRLLCVGQEAASCDAIKRDTAFAIFGFIHQHVQRTKQVALFQVKQRKNWDFYIMEVLRAFYDSSSSTGDLLLRPGPFQSAACFRAEDGMKHIDGHCNQSCNLTHQLGSNALGHTVPTAITSIKSSFVSAEYIMITTPNGHKPKWSCLHQCVQ
jgi:hypothetical protein